MVGVLIAAPISTAANPTYTLAQDGFDINNLLESLLTDGAEVMFANIDDQGVPGVIYGQLGIPSDNLAFDNPMYDGCIAMALVSTHGEFLDIVMDLLAGGDMFGGDGNGGEFALAQDGGGFDPNSILDMLGTEFNLLITVFINVAEADSLARMAQIQAHLSTQYQFSFLELLNLRIDESLFPPDSEITLPFDSIDVYIRQETHDFAFAVDAMFDVMSDDGFLGSIDQTYFTGADASAGGLIAIPDMAEIVDLIEMFSGGDGGSEAPPLYTLAQTIPFEVEGPIAIAAAGYLGEQVLSTDTTSINVENLLGVTGTLTPLPSGNSLLATMFPDSTNITSITPDVEGQSYYNSTEGVVFWNATALGPQDDYIVNFEGDFPPLVTIEREFSPASGEITPGGSTTVTVTVTNEGDEPITDLIITDAQLATIYDTVTVTGTTTVSVASLDGGASTTMTYTVTFANEGGYTFMPAELVYEYEGESFFKDTMREGFEVAPDVGGLMYDAIMDGMPYTGVALGVVGLVGIYAIMGLLKNRDGPTYQV
jgi:hypothetical protein